MCLAPGGQRFEQDCTLCHDPENRTKWGCDAPAAEPITSISPCPFCRGGQASCVHCGGTDEVPIFRCPNKLVTNREIDVIAAAAMVERGVLPDPGGWNDQASTFVQAFPFLTREFAHWQRVHQEQAAKKANRH